MKAALRSLIGGIILHVALCAAVSAAANVEEQIVGPVGQDVKYVVSPRGVHLATVAPKGSRVAVIVDGVEGPKFDEIVSAYPYVDSRPLQEAQRTAALAGRIGPDTSARLVIFSKDGSRFAYVGRQGQEWVLMADGKEVVRIPIAGTASVPGAFGISQQEIRLELTGEDGKHLMFSRTVFGGYEFWVDGKKMPALHLGGAIGGGEDPAITRDGSRFAYLGVADRKRVVIVDGREAGYIGENLRFSADGKHLIAVDRGKPNDNQVLMDGKPIIRAQSIHEVYVAPAGDRIIVVLSRENPDRSRSFFLVVDGKQVEASVCQGISKVVFSPDGKRYAASCKAGNNVEFMVVDGKKGQHYDAIWMPETLAFSPDSSKVGYVAQSRGKFFVVINEEESDAFEGAALKFLFSPDGKRTAFCGNRQSPPPGGFKLYVDGKLERIDEQANCASVTFSPDGSHYAYATSSSGSMYLDGKPTGLRGEKFVFTPDSKRVAVWGNKPSVDPKQGVLAQFARPAAQGLFVDGQHVWGTFGNQNLRYRAFSPDSQHLYWMTLERPSGPSAKPGLIEAVIYLDGKPVVRTDRIDSGEVASMYPGGQFNFGEPPPAWEVGPDGVLTFLVPVGDVIKRFRITPSSDTNIVTMIADAEAEAVKAKADADATKPAPRGRRNR